ncbi:MAG: hypothetical protein IKD10_12375 [Lentisphaeria bacterium]|nr:hypothetical protein [Lentisphaeria bacterium]
MYEATVKRCGDPALLTVAIYQLLIQLGSCLEYIQAVSAVSDHHAL